MEVKLPRNFALMASVLIVFLTAILMFAYYSRWFSFSERIGPYRIIHYLAFAGTLYIAFGVAAFSWLRRRSSQHNKSLLGIHVFGNLLSFLLVSLHFAGQVGRPAEFYPEFGTGLALYVAMLVMVVTGLFLRFKAQSRYKTNRFVHAGTALGFYIVISIHILHGIGLL